MKKLIFISLGLMLVYTAAQATHIKGGMVTYEHISGSSYKITVTGYTDADSPSPFINNGSIEFGDGHFTSLYGDGSDPGIPIGENIKKYEFEFFHTYSSPGTYLVKYQELYRNSGILNMENSINMPFFCRG